MVADDVKVAVVDEDLVLLEQELYVLLGGAHEVVQHGEVHIGNPLDCELEFTGWSRLISNLDSFW